MSSWWVNVKAALWALLGLIGIGVAITGTIVGSIVIVPIVLLVVAFGAIVVAYKVYVNPNIRGTIHDMAEAAEEERKILENFRTPKKDRSDLD